MQFENAYVRLKICHSYLHRLQIQIEYAKVRTSLQNLYYSLQMQTDINRYT